MTSVLVETNKYNIFMYNKVRKKVDMLQSERVLVRFETGKATYIIKILNIFASTHKQFRFT